MNKAQKIGLATLVLALVLALADLRMAIVPVVLFILLYLIAPFLYRFGFFLPVISRGNSGQRIVALTFDDGPDPRTTPLLLDLLSSHQVRATFFVTGKRVAAYPDLIRVILDRGHTIGNHSFTHDPLVAFKGAHKIGKEISKTQKVLTDLGVTPLLFRPPVGITYPRLAKALSESGLETVTFSCRAMDAGNRSVRHLSKRILTRVRPDDIIMLHDSRPLRPAHLALWLGEVSRILSGISAKGMTIRPLAEVIGREVDRRPYQRERLDL